MNHVNKICIVFHHNSFPDQELHIVARYTKVESEGAEENFFEVKGVLNTANTDANNVEDDVIQPDIPQTGAKEDL